ncbi:hypothetical protein BN871_BM_00540 [Paenibacillus sp. P22]|nr:hypothetical protein BN871_BM_00540 [Paenibacillus sp. P22]
MFLIEVAPLTPSTLESFVMSFRPVIGLPCLTSSDWPALKYTSEKSTCFLRSSVIVIVATMRSMSPLSSIWMRVLLVTSLSSILLSSPKIFLAIALEMSMSKPSTLPEAVSLRPNSFVSYLTPTMSLPRSLISLMTPDSSLPPAEPLLAEPPPLLSFFAPHPETTRATASSRDAPAPQSLFFFIVRFPFSLSGLVVDDPAQEVAGARLLRTFEEVRRLRFLDDPSAVHEHDPVRHFAGKAHLMGNDDHCHAFLGKQLHDAEHLSDDLRIQRRGRLVEQHDLGLHGQASGNGNPLLLAARQLGRVRFRLVGNSDLFEIHLGGLARFFLAYPSGIHRSERNIVDDLEMRIQVEMLKNHADAAAESVDVRPLVMHGRAVHLKHAVRDVLQPVDAAQKRAFARSGRPDDDDDLAFGDIEADVLKDMKIPEVLVDLPERNHGIPPFR